MPRARNIKPGFFVNDKLGDLEPLARLLFIGLWTLADCEGRLEDRPKQIKAQVLPYDNCAPEELLNNLDLSGFIQRYSVQGQPVIQIKNFIKHQNPHKNERAKGSDYGPYEERDEKQQENQEDSRESRIIQNNPDKDGTAPADSLLLKEERGKRNDDSPAKQKTKRFSPPTLEEVMAYCNERNNTVDPENFIDHYEANGWMRGKNKVKNWKACVRTWEKNNFQSKKTAQQEELPQEFFDSLEDHDSQDKNAIPGECERLYQ